ncbi:MAG: hypothetical protein V9G19_04280 [Tetrasphaera sp.]
MTATLASCWACAPWRLEAARSAAAWLDAVGAGPSDVVRADLDGLATRESPRALMDRRLRHTVSLPAPAPETWQQLSAYAESAVRAIRAWARGGARWEAGYSGTSGLVDHLVLALARGNGTVPTWTAHLIDLPTHKPTGARRDAPVVQDALLHTCARLLRGWEVPEPASDQVADWVLALVAGGADRIVVGSPELADALAATPGWAAVRGVRSRVEVWARPPLRDADPGHAGISADGGPAGDDRVPDDRVHITGSVDAARLPVLDPVLRAVTLLERAERDRIRLTLVTDDVAPVATVLRRHGLEDEVAVVGPGTGRRATSPAPGGTAQRLRGLTLVVDAPTPEGLPWSPAPLPDLGDAEARGGEIILLAAQDSPLTRRPVAHHLPAEHVSAARALLSRLAN